MKRILIIGIIALASIVLSGCNFSPVVPLGEYNTEDELKVNDKYHDYVVNGERFYLGQTFTSNVGDEIYFIGCTNGKEVYFDSFQLNTEAAPFYIEIYENPTVTTNGTMINAINLNRELDYDATLKIYYNPTIATEGDLIYNNVVLGTNKLAESFDTGFEFLLNSSTCYTIKITNSAGNGILSYANFFWHETTH